MRAQRASRRPASRCARGSQRCARSAPCRPARVGAGAIVHTATPNACRRHSPRRRQSSPAGTSHVAGPELADWWRCARRSRARIHWSTAPSSRISTLTIALTRLQQARTYEAVCRGSCAARSGCHRRGGARNRIRDLARGRASEPLVSADNATGLRTSTRSRGF